ncbi:hypothetical protein [Demequina aestuarii]|uniref:hypothetical protein n=1 Tax=Demequina aestuarii TaxID=327095 RepID=UPI00128E1A47|nr:hypothetical protein [Demequina aestuarii]
MIREDWAQQGTGMERNSASIRKWLGNDRFALFVLAARAYLKDRPADREAAGFIGASAQRVGPANFSDLVAARDTPLRGLTAVALHPYRDEDVDALRTSVANGTLGRLFVMVWAPHEVARMWLEAVGAVNLYTGSRHEAPDDVMVEAARVMVSEEYNGLESGHGKDAVVGLMRAFRAKGYPSDEKSWARAFLVAGGSLRSLESVRKFAAEIEGGTRHRVEPRFREGIVDILAKRAKDGAS